MPEILIRKMLDGEWKSVESVRYIDEAELQRLLEESPSLIPVTEIQAQPSKLVVAVPEVGLPGSGSTDLICLSAAGDIALVECKLATNAEIKRKVIGQILEYGAYLWGMGYDELDRRIQRIRRKSMADLVIDSIKERPDSSQSSSEWNEEAFRENVRDSLAKGTFILIIIVDQINDELERIINFIGTCGTPSFSFHALAMQRFRSDDTEILVPHLYGPSLPVKTNRERWTELRFFQKISSELDVQACKAIEDLYKWSKNTAHEVIFGTGKEVGSFTFYYLKAGKLVTVFSVYTNGNLSLNYGALAGQIDKPILEKFHKSIIAVPGLGNLPGDFDRWPSVRISELVRQPDSLVRFTEAVKELGIVIETATKS
jgi:hypothetical protein